MTTFIATDKGLVNAAHIKRIGPKEESVHQSPNIMAYDADDRLIGRLIDPAKGEDFEGTIVPAAAGTKAICIRVRALGGRASKEERHIVAWRVRPPLLYVEPIVDGPRLMEDETLFVVRPDGRLAEAAPVGRVFADAEEAARHLRNQAQHARDYPATLAMLRGEQGADQKTF